MSVILNSALIKFIHAVPKGYLYIFLRTRAGGTYVPWYIIGNADVSFTFIVHTYVHTIIHASLIQNH